MVLFFGFLVIGTFFNPIEAKIYNTVTETEINHEEESQESFEYEGSPETFHKLGKALGVYPKFFGISNATREARDELTLKLGRLNEAVEEFVDNVEVVDDNFNVDLQNLKRYKQGKTLAEKFKVINGKLGIKSVDKVGKNLMMVTEQVLEEEEELKEKARVTLGEKATESYEAQVEEEFEKLANKQKSLESIEEKIENLEKRKPELIKTIKNTTPEKTEQISEKTEQTPEKTEETPEKTEVTSEKTEQIPEKTEETPEKTEQIPEKTEETSEKTEWTSATVHFMRITSSKVQLTVSFGSKSILC